MKNRLLTSLPAALLAGGLFTACTSNTPPVAQTPDQPATPAAAKTPTLEMDDASPDVRHD